MKILKVIHGYPPDYNAGSEVYSQNLCHALALDHEVHVFTRYENQLLPDYEYQQTYDSHDPNIRLHRVNLPRERNALKYAHTRLNQKFDQVVKNISPDVAHIGHLNHLSIDIVDILYQYNIPIVFTLHDFWLMCPRGQFLQRNSSPPFQLCHSQNNSVCAKECFQSAFASDHAGIFENEILHWAQWVGQRMDSIKAMCQKVDCFIAPSHYLKNRFISNFGISNSAIEYLDYGFNLLRLSERLRIPGQPFTFGYIGTHIPSKGIQDLIQAFASLKSNSPAQLKIWGRPQADLTPHLKKQIATFPLDVSSHIEWMGEYENQHIVRDVFNHVDAIVVPSIWAENSPLVIHEAQQLRIPVITADYGGMAEYVHHQENGLLYKMRDIEDLTHQMSIFVDNPQYAKQLGERGYLYSHSRDIPDIQDHVTEILKIYARCISEQLDHKEGTGNGTLAHYV